MLRPGRSVVSVVVATLVAVTLSLGTVSAAAGAPGPTRPLSTSGIAHWRAMGSYTENSVTAGEGVATVTRANHSRYEVYRGILSVPKNLAAEGWGHIGDPDAAHGDIFDAYQGPGSGHTKMFLVTTPSGRTIQYVHTRVPRELYDNSFDAISPDGQWMVAGEWDTMSHLQIYPAPLLNRRTSASGGSLRLAGFIKLDHKVNDIQGCDFTTETMLICVSDDDSRSLFTNEKPLLEVDLSGPLHGRSVTGHVVDLGAIPQRSSCTGTYEAEGDDYDTATGILRVEIVPPGSCIIKTTIYEYAHRG